VETPRCGKWRDLPSYDVIWRHMTSYDVIWRVIWRHMTQWPSYDVIWRNIFFFEFFFKIFYFHEQTSLFVLFNTFLWVENAFFIFDFYFRSLKFELKGNSTSVWSKKSLCMEKVSNTFKQPKSPFLRVYLVRPSRCQELAGPCKTLVYAGPSKSDLWDLATTC
jgi:hypothetical protein